MDNKQTSLRSSKKAESRLKGARKAAGVDLNDSSGGLQTALSDKLFTDAGVSVDRLFTSTRSIVYCTVYCMYICIVPSHYMVNCMCFIFRVSVERPLLLPNNVSLLHEATLK